MSEPGFGLHESRLGEGQTGSALMESLQMLCRWMEILFGTPVKSIFPRMPELPFFQSGKIHFFLGGHISVDPSCP